MRSLQALFGQALLPLAVGYVCQVLTKENDTLQDSLQFHCEVSGLLCNCSSSFIQGDGSGRCVASMGGQSMPTLQTCPPGFYCLGGLEPPRSCSAGDHCAAGTGDAPRRCPEGYFCPIPAAAVEPCPAGGHCPAGTTSPQACAAGRFCRLGQEGLCPEGRFCPFGTEYPQKCPPFASCPEGSKAPNRWFFSLLILLSGASTKAVASAALVAGVFYPWMVQHGVWLCVITAICIGLMWLVDQAIALFLSLTFVSVAANWALLRMGGFNATVASGLVSCTGLVAVALLWLVHPPWAAFLGGTIGYLMSRQNFGSVIVGRILMLALFVFLIYEYSRVDPDFTMALGVLFFCLLLGILVSWVRVLP
eukprot:g9535.t1